MDTTNYDLIIFDQSARELAWATLTFLLPTYTGAEFTGIQWAMMVDAHYDTSEPISRMKVLSDTCCTFTHIRPTWRGASAALLPRYVRVRGVKVC
jgi:hypothetical protein